MLYCARLVQCICLFTFQPMSRDVNIDALTPPFFLFFPNIRQSLLFGLSTTQYQCTFFLITFCCFTFVFHIPTASCWLTVCLSVDQILIFHVCFFFPTQTSCIQRMYKGQFKILQSYFVFIIKCHWRRNTKYSTLFVYMFTYGR